MKRANEILATYVSDMIALERHILEAVDRQSNDETVKSFAQAILTIEKVKRNTQAHVAVLEAHLKTLGETSTAQIKQAVTALTGLASGLIDKVRVHGVAKDLRDDYTALSLAAISYTMLDSAALGLGHYETANLAKRHLEDLTPLIVEISEIMPFVVVNELVGETPVIDLSAAEQAARNTHHAWSRQVVAHAA
jgi:ferritin-like metal-binding protein YciE